MLGAGSAYTFWVCCVAPKRGVQSSTSQPFKVCGPVPNFKRFRGSHLISLGRQCKGWVLILVETGLIYISAVMLASANSLQRALKLVFPPPVPLHSPVFPFSHFHRLSKLSDF